MTAISPIASIPLIGFLCLLVASGPCLAQSPSPTPTLRTRSNSLELDKAKSSDRNAEATRNLINGAPADWGQNKPTDLRPVLKTMTRKEGGNLVFKARNHKLFAEVSGSKIVRWSATDDNGKPLPTQVMAKGVRCTVCVETPGGWKICYDISCDDAPAPKKKSEVPVQR